MGGSPDGKLWCKAGLRSSRGGLLAGGKRPRDGGIPRGSAASRAEVALAQGVHGHKADQHRLKHKPALQLKLGGEDGGLAGLQWQGSTATELTSIASYTSLHCMLSLEEVRERDQAGEAAWKARLAASSASNMQHCSISASCKGLAQTP